MVENLTDMRAEAGNLASLQELPDSAEEQEIIAERFFNLKADLVEATLQANKAEGAELMRLVGELDEARKRLGLSDPTDLLTGKYPD